jgi:hypothetical protein
MEKELGCVVLANVGLPRRLCRGEEAPCSHHVKEQRNQFWSQDLFGKDYMCICIWNWLMKSQNCVWMCLSTGSKSAGDRMAATVVPQGERKGHIWVHRWLLGGKERREVGELPRYFWPRCDRGWEWCCRMRRERMRILIGLLGRGKNFSLPEFNLEVSL